MCEKALCLQLPPSQQELSFPADSWSPKLTSLKPQFNTRNRHKKSSCILHFCTWVSQNHLHFGSTELSEHTSFISILAALLHTLHHNHVAFAHPLRANLVIKMHLILNPCCDKDVAILISVLIKYLFCTYLGWQGCFPVNRRKTARKPCAAGSMVQFHQYSPQQ